MESAVKKALPICFLACVAWAMALLIGLGVWRDSRYESPTYSYPTLTNTHYAQALGWIPGFLPSSAINIREKRHYGDNATIMAFDFDPVDFGSFSSRFVSVPSNRLNEIRRPRPVRKKEPWFPKAILKGQLDKMMAQGFILYQKETKSHTRRGLLKERWFAAIHPQKGICYMWR